jgi:hypothetical protein
MKTHLIALIVGVGIGFAAAAAFGPEPRQTPAEIAAAPQLPAGLQDPRDLEPGKMKAALDELAKKMRDDVIPKLPEMPADFEKAETARLEAERLLESIQNDPSIPPLKR